MLMRYLQFVRASVELPIAWFSLQYHSHMNYFASLSTALSLFS